MSGVASMKIPLYVYITFFALVITLCYAKSNNKARRKKCTQQTSFGACGHSAWFCAPGIPGIPGSPGPAGSPGNKGPEGPTGPRGNKGDKGSVGKQGPKGDTGSSGPAGPAGPAGSKGRKGEPGAPGSLGRNWKQCVFKSMNDDRDTGLIKECIFKKKSDKTALRVFWNGDFRVGNCHNCCNRWYFTFNGAECSAPAAIDGVFLVYQGTSWKKNPHRPRHIEGICEKIHRGTVRVGLWVGKCAGNWKTGDAYTGWNSVSRIYIEEVSSPQP